MNNIGRRTRLPRPARPGVANLRLAVGRYSAVRPGARTYGSRVNFYFAGTFIDSRPSPIHARPADKRGILILSYTHARARTRSPAPLAMTFMKLHIRVQTRTRARKSKSTHVRLVSVQKPLAVNGARYELLHVPFSF